MATVFPGGDVPHPCRVRRPGIVLLLGTALLLTAGFLALGTWQIHRMAWKHDLIDRVTRRVHAPPVDAPPPALWPTVTARSDEYRHVRLHGVFLDERATRVQAVTELGSGSWVLTPLRRDDGSIVLVNRGFVAADTAGVPAAAPRVADVTGLLRMTEPDGGFLRKNEPAADRWFSRDVVAIAARRSLSSIGPVAPYFVDADAGPLRPQQGPAARTGHAGVAPVGGLTVIAFSDNHLVYALTWYALGLMVAGAAAWLLYSRAGSDAAGDHAL